VLGLEDLSPNDMARIMSEALDGRCASWRRRPGGNQLGAICGTSCIKEPRRLGTAGSRLGREEERCHR
jgi:hypothetical protein